MTGKPAQRFLIERMMSLPAPILRTLSGGGVVYRNGRTLDPRFQFLQSVSRNRPSPSSMEPPEVREKIARAYPSIQPRPERGVRTERLVVEGPNGPVPCRVYRPDLQDSAAAVLVFAHGGGGVVGNLEITDALCSILASVAMTAVVSVDYRLAPEHRFPAGLEDTLAVYRYVRDHAVELGGAEGRAAVGGESIGANFAAVIAQTMKATGELQPDLQLLLYPVVDMASETASMTTFADAFPLTRRTMEWALDHYMGPKVDPADPRLSPIRAADLKGLAPAIVVAAGFDPLIDQVEAYARALKAAGVPTTYRCYDSLAHGFAEFTGIVPAADQACREIAALVRAGLDGQIGKS